MRLLAFSVLRAAKRCEAFFGRRPAKPTDELRSSHIPTKNLVSAWAWGGRQNIPRVLGTPSWQCLVGGWLSKSAAALASRAGLFVPATRTKRYCPRPGGPCRSQGCPRGLVSFVSFVRSSRVVGECESRHFGDPLPQVGHAGARTPPFSQVPQAGTGVFIGCGP